MNSNVALLILGANAPFVLARLLECANKANFKSYVHIDSKVNLGEYKARVGSSVAHAEFLNERFDVFWCGFNMVMATISLIKRVLLDTNIKTLALVSDDTFFLHSPEMVYQSLLDAPLRIDDYLINEDNPRYNRYRNFYFLDSPLSSARTMETERRNVDPVEFHAVAERMLNLHKNGKWEAPLRMGSQWWSMDRALAENLIDVVGRRQDIVQSFEFSAIPDEMFFQTLAPLKSPADKLNLRSPMLYDFSRDPKPFIFRNESELNGLDLTNKLFLRKVTADSYFVNRFK